MYKITWHVYMVFNGTAIVSLHATLRGAKLAAPPLGVWHGYNGDALADDKEATYWLPDGTAWAVGSENDWHIGKHEVKG